MTNRLISRRFAIAVCAIRQYREDRDPRFRKPVIEDAEPVF